MNPHQTTKLVSASCENYVVTRSPISSWGLTRIVTIGVYLLAVSVAVATMSIASGQAIAPVVTMTSGSDMNQHRMGHYTVALTDGRVAVLGGHGPGFTVLKSLEVWNATSLAFANYAMPYTMDGGALVRLSDGRYLLAGGASDLGGAPGHNNAQIYDPASNTVSAVSGTLKFPRCNTAGALLSNGKVLIAGGWYSVSSSTYGEVFDPVSGQFTATGKLNTPRSTAVVLPTADGKAVVAGGLGPQGTPAVVDRVELFDPSTNGFSVLAESLFAGEKGWALIGNTGNSIDTFQMGDGRYALLTHRTTNQTTEWVLALFDPASKRFSKLAIQPAFTEPVTVLGGVIDRERNAMYFLGGTNRSNAANFIFRVYGVSLATGQRLLESGVLTNAGYYLGGSSMTLLKDGRILVTGGTTSVNASYNFNPVNKTLLLAPSGSDEDKVVLKIRGVNTGAIISWPTTAQNYVLYSADQISAARWQPVPISPALVANEFSILIEAGPAQQFYRLQKTSGPGVVVDAVRVFVSPSAVTLTPGARQNFVGSVSNAQNTSVLWSVEEGATGGTIDGQGVYTAPGTPGFYHVVATSLADSSIKAMAVVFVSNEPPNSPYFPHPVVSGSTTEESKSFTTTVGQPGSVSLTDGTKIEIPAMPSPVSVTLRRASNTLNLSSALQQPSGSMRIVTYSGILANSEFVPRITFPASEAGALKVVNIARVGELTSAESVMKDQIVFLPAEIDASGNLSARDIFLRTSAPAVGLLGLRAETPATVTIQYSVSTYEGNLNWSVKPQLVRMIPDATDRTPLSKYPQQAQEEILRRPIQNVVLLVHGHNETERFGHENPDVSEPWLFAYKRDVWHFLYREFQAKYPEYVDCTAFYEYIYPSFRPIFGGADSLGNDFARLVETDARLKEMKQNYHLFVVAHSMGGLVARAGLNRLDASVAANFDKLVTWGTPHHGSPVVTLRYLLTGGFTLADLNPFTKICPTAPPLQILNEFAFYRNFVSSTAVDTPGERELRWDNHRPLDLYGAGWRRGLFQILGGVDDLASSPKLYNDTLRIFNNNDKFALTDKYAALFGITSKTVDMGYTCLGLKNFKNAPSIAQGNVLIRWVYNDSGVLTDYPIQPSVKDNDGAVPVDSMVGLGIIQVLQTRHLGDVDHEEYFGASAGSGTASRTFVALNVKDTATKRCDCPTLTVAKIQPAASTAEVTGKVVWPGDAKPGQRVLRISVVQGQANSRVLSAAQSFTIQDDGSFAAVFDVAVLNAASGGQAPIIVAQMKDGTELLADFSISPLAVTLPAGGRQAFTATVTFSTNTAVTWKVPLGAAGGTITSSGIYTAPDTSGTFYVVATSLADTNKSAMAAVTVTQQVSVAISPSSVTISTNASQAFTVTGIGASGALVNWSVQEGPPGGTVTETTIENVVLYTAPAKPGTYHIVVTSLADTNKSASATVTVSVLRHWEIYWDSLFVKASEIKSASSLMAKLNKHTDGVSLYLFERFSRDAPELLSEPLVSYYLDELNRIIKGPPASIYEDSKINGVSPFDAVLSQEAKDLLAKNTTDLLRLNRMLLEDAYPLEIERKPLLLKEEWWTDEKGQRTGTLRTYNRSGVLIEEQSYVDGVPSGLYVNYYDNGSTHLTANWSNGEINGLKTEWYRTGQVMWQGSYLNSKLNGLVTAWDFDGFKLEEATYVDGKKNGRETVWGRDGSKAEVTRRDDKLNGPYIIYYANGGKKEVGNYLDGKKNGVFIYFIDTGVKTLEVNYVQDILNGQETAWYTDGSIEHQGNYSMGVKTGTWTYYFIKTGRVKHVDEYP